MAGYLEKAKRVRTGDRPGAPAWRDCTPEEAREELVRYKREGWIAIYSEVLGEPIILARDEEAAKVAPAGFVTYTEAEVALLLTATPDELRQVHEAKRHFGGRITGREATEHGDYDRSNSHRDGQ